MLAELALLSSAQPHPAYASTSSAVQPMLTLEHFEAALERARQHNRLVVIKFYQVALSIRPPPQTTAPDHTQPHRCDWALTSAHGSAPGRHPKPNPNHRTPSPRPSPCPDQARCKACLNARAAYEKAAKGPLAERADFYEVDQSVGRLLCTLAKVAPLPVLVARAHRAPAPRRASPRATHGRADRAAAGGAHLLGRRARGHARTAQAAPRQGVRQEPHAPRGRIRPVEIT